MTITDRGEERVRAHSFLCLLPYYVEWHMRQALSSLLFDDELLCVERKHRDFVAPAKLSTSARRKKSEWETEEGLPIHSFAMLMVELGIRCRHLCRMNSYPDSPAFFMDTLP